MNLTKNLNKKQIAKIDNHNKMMIAKIVIDEHNKRVIAESISIILGRN